MEQLRKEGQFSLVCARAPSDVSTLIAGTRNCWGSTVVLLASSDAEGKGRVIGMATDTMDVMLKHDRNRGSVVFVVADPSHLRKQPSNFPVMAVFIDGRPSSNGIFEGGWFPKDPHVAANKINECAPS